MKQPASNAPGPFLKWPGGKRKHLDQITASAVRALGGDRDRVEPLDYYVEPFVGGGAVYYHLRAVGLIMDKTTVLLSDASPALMVLYRVVRDECEGFLAELGLWWDEYQVAWETSPCPHKVAETLFMAARMRVTTFLQDDPPIMASPSLGDAAAILIVNQAGFNGLWRVNRGNGCNVPWGKRNLPEWDAVEVRIKRASKALQGVLLETGDFRAVFARDDLLCDPRQLGLRGVPRKSFARGLLFADPPYCPLPGGDKDAPVGFTGYTAKLWTPRDHERLFSLFASWRAQGGAVVTTNGSYPNTNNAYCAAQFQIKTIGERRSINRDGKGRGAIACLLATGPPRKAELVRLPAPATGDTMPDDNSLAAQEALPGTLYENKTGRSVRVISQNADGSTTLLNESVPDMAPLKVPGSYRLFPEGHIAAQPEPEPEPEPAQGCLLSATEKAPQPRAKSRATAKRIFVTKIRTNVKGVGDVELGQHTVIYGENASGKTAIQQALLLAVTGETFDIAGRRTIKASQDVISLLPPDGGDTLEAVATFSSGATSSYRLTDKGNGKLSLPKVALAELKVATPLKDVWENLRSPKKAAPWMLRAVAAVDSHGTVIEALSPDLRSTYKRIYNASSSPSDALVAAQASVAVSVRSRKTALKGTEANIDAGSASLGPCPTAEAIIEAKMTLQEADQRVAQAARSMGEQDTTSPAVLRAQIEEHRALVQKYGAAIHQVEHDGLAQARTIEQRAVVALGVVDDPAKRAAAEAVVVFLEYAVAQNDIPCLGCGRPVTKANSAARLNALVAALKAKDDALTTQRAAVATARAGVVVQEGRIANGRYKIRALEDTIRQREQQLQAVPGTATSTGGPSLEEAQQAQASARAFLRVLEQDEAAHTLLANQRAARDEIRTALEAETRLNAELDRLVDRFVRDSATAFTARVQSYLPETINGTPITFWMDATKGRYGILLRNAAGKVICRKRALSGVEAVCVDMAVAMAVTPADTDVAILFPEDRDWSPKALREALKVWSSFQGQVVIATATKAYRGFPAGWQVVETSK